MLPLLVFDLDGTLIDSRRDITDAANALLVECGGAPLSELRIGRMVGEGAAVLLTRAFDAAGVDRPADALERYLALYDRRLLVHTRPYPGIVAALEALAGRASLAVLTNKPLGPTRRILDGLDLARFFPREAVLGGDGPWPRKPDPAGLRHLTGRVGVAPADSVLVGDSLTDWSTARAAGAQVCMARYGFGYETFPAGTLQPGDLGADTPADLSRVLKA
jgi:phosphoglycolate phosphatase